MIRLGVRFETLDAESLRLALYAYPEICRDGDILKVRGLEYGGNTRGCIKLEVIGDGKWFETYPDIIVHLVRCGVLRFIPKPISRLTYEDYSKTGNVL